MRCRRILWLIAVPLMGSCTPDLHPGTPDALDTDYGADAEDDPGEDEEDTATATETSDGPVEPLATASKNCVAPCTVFFDGRETTWPDSSEADRLLALDYTWNFGDPESGVWRTGARGETADPHSRNIDSGFVAAHTYEAPGSYEVNLTVCDGDVCEGAPPLTVEIGDPEATWGASTVCISTTTDHTACPPGAELISNVDDFDEVFNDQGCDDGTIRCLFHSGHTFYADEDVSLSGSGEHYIGTYGPQCPGADCEAATIETTAPTDVFRFSSHISNARIVDLHLVGSLGDHTAISAAETPASHTLLLRVDIEDFDQGYLTRCSLREDTGRCIPGTDGFSKYISMIDSSITGGSAQGGNDLYLTGEPYAIMGSLIANKRDPNTVEGDVGEHTVRIKYTGPGSVFSHNSLGLFDNAPSAANRSGHAYVGCFPRDVSTNEFYPNEPGWEGSGAPQGNLVLKMPSGYAPTLATNGDDPRAGWSRYYVLADNWLSSCRYGAWMATIGKTDSGVGKAAEHHRFFIVERNLFTAQYAERPDVSFIMLRIDGAAHYIVKNNLFDLTGVDGSTRAMVLAASPWPDDPNYQTPENGNLLHNSVINQAGRDDRTLFDIGEDVHDTTIANHLFWDSSGEGDLIRNSGTDTLCCGGACPGACNILTSSNPFGAFTDPPLPEAFRLTDAGIGPGIEVSGMVQRDLALCLRPDLSTPQLGAWDAGNTCP